MGIVRFALRWPYTFYVLAILILFLGATAFRSMPTDIFPEIDIPVVTVIWQYTGLDTPEMEQRVTTYSQYAISTSVNGIKDIEAQTLNGKINAPGSETGPGPQLVTWGKSTILSVDAHGFKFEYEFGQAHPVRLARTLTDRPSSRRSRTGVPTKTKSS
jgi:hypothetical protein